MLRATKSEPEQPSARELALDRRQVLRLSLATAAAAFGSAADAAPAAVTTGASSWAAQEFDGLAGRRVGLITNQTGRVGSTHLVDLLARTTSTRNNAPRLTTVFAPEHGFRGTVEAGIRVGDERDPATGIRVFSLYGATRAPTPAMLRDIDVLMFDIQDIGVRFYTYISTMGLAMQAAARRRIPFVVLDRPNPLGGDDVAGFKLEPRYRSFVGQYPIPIAHGLTVGELARMIKGERWLDDLTSLDLQVVPVKGWRRADRWPATKLPWVPTSPNIPTFESALAYPGIGIVGETLVNEGRGTPEPFLQFGAPWLDAAALAGAMNERYRGGVRFEATNYVPVAIANVAATPRFRGENVAAVRLRIMNANAVKPLEIGMQALAQLQQAAKRQSRQLLPPGPMFTAIAGTNRLRSALERGATGDDLIGSWQTDVTAFKRLREPYLLY